MKLAIVGAGRMGGAILTGALTSGVLDASEVGIYHPDDARRDALASRFGVAPLDDDAVHHAERVLVGVKPQRFAAVAPAIARRGGCFLSIMAGTPAHAIAARLGTGRVIRAMPNLGARIGRSSTAITALADASDADRRFAHDLFSAVGSVHEVDESLFDAFTGLAGSGPAFVAVLAEALADAGVRVGFGRTTSEALVREVLLATATLLEDRGAAEIKNEVASPAGTAIAGVRALEQSNARYAMIHAVEEATKRAMDLSRVDG